MSYLLIKENNEYSVINNINDIDINLKEKFNISILYSKNNKFNFSNNSLTLTIDPKLYNDMEEHEAFTVSKYHYQCNILFIDKSKNIDMEKYYIIPYNITSNEFLCNIFELLELYPTFLNK